MNVALDTFDLGVDDTFLINNIAGLGSSDIRTSQFNFSGRSGGLVTDQFYGMRLVTITGLVKSDTCDQHEIDRTDFNDASPIDTLIPVHFTLFSGAIFLLNANVINLTMEYRSGGKASDYKLDLLAGDPLFYAEDGGSDHSAAVSRVEQGGYDTPYILPVNWDSGSSPTIVSNTGNSFAYPTITLSDSAINPVITNQTTGEIFELDLTMVDGDVLVIDMQNRTASLNSSNVIGNVTSDSTWWALAIGDNSITLDSDSGSDNISALIEWRNGQTGI